jgi:hypothetical protein
MRQEHMSRRTAGALALAVLLLAAPLAFAQAPPAAPATPRATPRPDQLEPGVDTSKMTPAAAAEPGNAGPAAAPLATPVPAPAPTPAPTPAGTAAGTAPAPKAADASGTAGKGTARKGAGTDRLNLDTTDIRGNRELPKVMYIVPWKRSDLGDLVGRPANSLLDEVLQPLDRDVFRRETRYYDALRPDQVGAKSDAAQGSGAKP